MNSFKNKWEDLKENFKPMIYDIAKSIHLNRFASWATLWIILFPFGLFCPRAWRVPYLVIISPCICAFIICLANQFIRRFFIKAGEGNIILVKINDDIEIFEVLAWSNIGDVYFIEEPPCPLIYLDEDGHSWRREYEFMSSVQITKNRGIITIPYTITLDLAQDREFIAEELYDALAKNNHRSLYQYFTNQINAKILNQQDELISLVELYYHTDKSISQFFEKLGALIGPLENPFSNLKNARILFNYPSYTAHSK